MMSASLGATTSEGIEKKKRRTKFWKVGELMMNSAKTMLNLRYLWEIHIEVTRTLKQNGNVRSRNEDS